MKEKKTKKVDKQQVKKVIFKSLHVLGYISIICWGLFGVLVGCSFATKQNDQPQQEQLRIAAPKKAPINNVVYDYIYDINDINGVYVDNLLYNDYSFYFTPYKAYSPFELYSYTNGSFYISTNLSAYTFINTMYNNLNYPYGLDSSLVEYDLTFNLLQTTDNGTANNLVKYYPVYNNYRFDNFELVPYINNGVVTYADFNVYFTNLTSGDQSIITYTFRPSGSDFLCKCYSKLHYDILIWLFNGDLFYSKILPNNSAYKYYERFIYLFNSKSINKIYAHTSFDYDSLSWLGLYAQNTKWTSIYGGYVVKLYNVANANDMFIDLLYGDFRYNGGAYHILRACYGLVSSTTYNGVRIFDLLGNYNEYTGNYIRFLKYFDLYNPNNGRSVHICDFRFSTYNYTDTSGSTPVDYNWLYYYQDYSYANNNEFVINQIIPYNLLYLDSQQLNYDYFDTTLLSNNNYSHFDSSLNYLSITQQSINYHDYSNFVDSEGVTWIQNSFTLISLGLEGIWGFLGIYILPGITIGTLILTPLLITLFLVLLKIFKAH